MAQELKAYNVVATVDVNPEVVDSLGCTEWAAYDADEVDAVLAEKDKEIAELKESHKNEVKQLLILNSEQANAANRLRDSMEQVIYHQKYKRCLWLARWCVQMMVFNSKYGTDKKWHIFKKWHKRWLELAEKFKEAKL